MSEAKYDPHTDPAYIERLRVDCEDIRGALARCPPSHPLYAELERGFRSKRRIYVTFLNREFYLKEVDRIFKEGEEKGWGTGRISKAVTKMQDEMAKEQGDA